MNHALTRWAWVTCMSSAISTIIIIINMPAAARKTRKENKSITTPDLHQHYHRVDWAGSLARVTKLWTSLGKCPARSAIGKDLAAEESYTLHRLVHYLFPHSRPSCLGQENNCGATWCTAASSERPMTAAGIFSLA